MKKLAVSLLAMLIAAPALADGMTTDFLAPTGRAPMAFSTGCYVKAYGQATSSTNTLNLATTTFNGFGIQDASFGAGAGCDYVWNRVVAGLFGDYTFNKGSASITAPGINFSLANANDWSVGARLGFLPTQTVLVYGLVALNGKTSSNLNMSGVGFNLANAFGDQHAASLGAGVEFYVLPKFTINVEFRHTGYDLNTSAGTIPMLVTREQSTNVVRVGPTIRF